VLIDLFSVHLPVTRRELPVVMLKLGYLYSLLLMLTVKLFVCRVHGDDQCMDWMN